MWGEGGLSEAVQSYVNLFTFKVNLPQVLDRKCIPISEKQAFNASCTFLFLQSLLKVLMAQFQGP